MFWFKLFLMRLPVIFLVSSCGEEEVQEEIIRPVRYMQVYSTGGSRVRSFTGVAQAGIESELSFKIPGTVKNIPVHIGDRVERGQLIAELDETDTKLRVQQAEAALSQARAQARNAGASYERIRALYENNNASRSELDGARTASESASAGLQTAEKQLEIAQLQLSYTRLSAPITGAIASVGVEVNENITSGEPIVTLTSGSDLEVKLSVPEVLISKMQVGQKVTVAFDALPDKEFSATIREVGVSSTGLGTTYPVTVRLNEKDDGVRPGMAATINCRFESGDERERIILPSHAVNEDRAGRFVYVVEADVDEIGYGIIHRRSVAVGDLTAEGLEIFEGLLDGELVVTAGVSRISENLKVRM